MPDRYVETATTLGASRAQVIGKVLVPLALPDIYKSLRSLFGMAFGYIMLAELINAEHGLGYLLSTSQRRGLSEHIILILHRHRRAGLLESTGFSDGCSAACFPYQGGCRLSVHAGSNEAWSTPAGDT